MTSFPDKSIEELREESELTREALASTVTQLRDRVAQTAAQIKTIVSPTHIKQEIRNYVRHEGESLVNVVQRKANENPLQTAAVAAAVAYPALGLLRSLPIPLWFVGAGLFLTSRRGRRAADNVKAGVEDFVRQGTEKAADFALSVRSNSEDPVRGAGSGSKKPDELVRRAGEALSDKARMAFDDARDTVTGATQATLSKATDVATMLSSKVSEASDAMTHRANEITRTSRNAVTDFVNENALLVAGISLAAGAFIAASIPTSEAENRLFGAGSEKLKEKVRDAAAQSIEKVGDLAAETAGSVSAAAAREGLDAAGVQDALTRVADSVRAVADRGVDTAVGNQRQTGVTTSFEEASAERNNL